MQLFKELVSYFSASNDEPKTYSSQSRSAKNILNYIVSQDNILNLKTKINANGKEWVLIPDDFLWKEFSKLLVGPDCLIPVEKDNIQMLFVCNTVAASGKIIIVIDAEKISNPDYKGTLNSLIKSVSAIWHSKFNAKAVFHVYAVKNANALRRNIYGISGETNAISSNVKHETDSAAREAALKIFKDALICKASDVHIEIRSVFTSTVRFRVNGDLINYDHSFKYKELVEISRVLYGGLGSQQSPDYIPGKIGAKALLNRKDLDFLDGTSGELRARFQAIPYGDPSNDDHDVVCRILPTEMFLKSIPLTVFGYTAPQSKLSTSSLFEASGLVAMAGTTGSGKTTTLANLVTMYKEANTIEGVFSKKVLTVEDPIEIMIPGITQTSVISGDMDSNEDTIDAYAKPIANALRADPDILLVSEIREEPAANAVVKGVTSGHLTLTTVHASSCILIAQRLIDIGIRREILGSKGFINLFTYQALAQVLCECKISYSEAAGKGSAYVKNWIKIIEQESIDNKNVDVDITKLHFKNSYGCVKCRAKFSPGIATRTAVVEQFKPDADSLIMIRGEQFVELDRYWLAKDGLGGQTFKAHALQKIEAGIIDPIACREQWGAYSRI